MTDLEREILRERTMELWRYWVAYGREHTGLFSDPLCMAGEIDCLIELQLLGLGIPKAVFSE